MKYCVYLLFFFLAIPAYAQHGPTPMLVEEFGEVCSEDLMARMDMFLIQITKEPSSKAVVMFHGREDTLGRNEYLASYIAKYPTVRGFDTSRIKVVRGESRKNQLVQFWLVPAGADEPKVKLIETPSYSKPTLFDRAWIGFNRWDGSLNIYKDEFWDLGCDFDPNRRILANTLKENPQLNAFLIVYTASKNRTQGAKLASLALEDLIKVFGVKRKRIRAIYGGARKHPEIEFWLVPRGHKRPAANSNRPPIRDS